MNNLPHHVSLTRLADPLPALLVDAREPGGLEAAVHGALAAAGLPVQRVAIFVVPLGGGPLTWSANVLGRGHLEAVEARARVHERVVVEDLSIDPLAHEVALRGQRVYLAAKEFALLHYLYERRGAVITREVLLRDVWGLSYLGGTRTVDVHIRRLRSKLGAHWFETTRGTGYKFIKE